MVMSALLLDPGRQRQRSKGGYDYSLLRLRVFT
jgi:hypothetical protein